MLGLSNLRAESSPSRTLPSLNQASSLELCVHPYFQATKSPRSIALQPQRPGSPQPTYQTQQTKDAGPHHATTLASAARLLPNRATIQFAPRPRRVQNRSAAPLPRQKSRPQAAPPGSISVRTPRPRLLGPSKRPGPERRRSPRTTPAQTRARHTTPPAIACLRSSRTPRSSLTRFHRSTHSCTNLP
jgi:hypothetical protein